VSHFRVTACVSDDDGCLARAAQLASHPGVLREAAEHVLEPVMAPWDENKEMPEYRSYEDGEPSGHWAYTSLQRAAERLARGELPEGEDERREQREKAALFAATPSPPSWADIVTLDKSRWGDDGDRLALAEDGRAYHLSTYNPDSKWDYWRIGGRWGGSLRFREGCASRVIAPAPGWDSPGDIAAGACDGGQLSALDLAATREEQAAQAAKTWQEFQDVVRGTPEALPWKSFSGRVGTAGYTIDHARADYHSQSRVQALEGTDFMWDDDPLTTYGRPLELHMERARAGAVPGFATITLDGRWMAPGTMGWWAMTDATDDTRAGYWEAANAYIESLPEDAWLFSLDCHI
jgi:hypothetical protein